MSLLRTLVRQERGALLGWGIGLFVYMLIIGLSYAAVKDSTEFDDIWAEFPDSLKEAFGGVQSITTVDGYLVSQATSYLPLLLGIYAVASATKRTAGAEESGRLDHELSRPVTRNGYLATLAGTLGMTTLVILTASTLGAVLGMAASGVRGGDLLRIVALFADLVPITLALVSVGLLLGTLYHRRSPAMGTGIAVVVGLFALEIVANLVDGLAWLSDVGLFGLWGQSDAFHGDVNVVYYLVASLILGGCTAGALVRFRRKDLYA